MSKASKPVPEYDYDAKVTREGNPTVVTVTVKVAGAVTAEKAVQRITGHNLRDEIAKRAGELGITNSGISTAGPYRTVFKDPEDRTSELVAYERDFKFTRAI